MPGKQHAPASLLWLGGLIALALAAAVAGAAVLYMQERTYVRREAEGLTGGSVAAGKLAIGRFGCGSCHAIPFVAGAHGSVGPSLGGIAVRAHLAGKLPNDPATMILWLQHPQRLAPGSGMPEMGVSRREARDMAAYLYTLR